MSAGEYDDVLHASCWVPQPGMRRMYDACVKVWGSPNKPRIRYRDPHPWPLEVLERVCERKLVAWVAG